MKFENTKVMNFEGAFRGMRNPLESWNKSDSFFGIVDEFDEHYIDIAYEWTAKTNVKDPYTCEETCTAEEFNAYDKIIDENMDWILTQGTLNSSDAKYEVAFIGPTDMDLAQRLIKAGAPDRKFLRQIFVSVDVTAPLYFWKELDTYKVGTVANSTSTMHKLASTPITLNCFEMDDFQNVIYYENEAECAENATQQFAEFMIEQLEWLRQKYNETKDKRYWKELIRWLPEGWLQTRTWTANYEILRNIYVSRKNHRLTEWEQFRKWIESLPYAQELILFDLKNA